MGVDLSIYNALLQPGPSAREISNALADRRMREQDQATQRQLNALQLGSAQQAANDEAAMRSALARLTPGATLEQRTSALRAIPSQKAWEAADALEKSELQRREKTATIGKSEFELKRQKQSALIQQVASLNSPDDAMQLLNGMVTAGEVPFQLANGYANLIKTDPKWQLKLIMGISDPSKMLELLKPHLQTVNAGNAQVQQVVDPITGKVTETGRTQIFQSPDSVASTGLGYAKLNEDKRHNKVSEDNAAQAAGGVEWKQDTNGNWVGLPKKVSGPGPVTPVPVAAPGKRETQANQAIKIIDEANKLIDGATGSYLGAGLDQAARVVGYGTEGATATAKLKALEGALMMAQPRMEGPQSDKDTALYRQMAAQIGDPTVPRSIKKEALSTVRALHEKYASPESAAAPAAPAASGPTPTADVDSLVNKYRSK